MKELKWNDYADRLPKDFASPYSIKVQSSIANSNDFAGLFLYDRFNKDRHLPRTWSQRIKNKWIKSAAHKMFITAYFDQREIGFILFKPGPELIIELVCVLDGFQGNGVGGLMLNALEEYSRSQKVEKLIVGTQDDNEHSIKMYRNFGFSRVDEKIVMHFYRGSK